MGLLLTCWVYTLGVCKELFSAGQFFYSGEHKVSIVAMDPVVVQEAPEYSESCLIMSLARGMKLGTKRSVGFCERCLESYKVSLKRKKN